MASGLTQAEIDIIIAIHGEQAVRRALENVGDQARRTERQTRSLSDGMNDLGDRMGNLGGPIGNLGGQIRQLSGMLGALGGIGALGAVALAAVAAGAAMEGLAIQMALAADDASEMADKMGVSVNRLEELKILADENSGSVEGYVKTLDKLAKATSKLDEDNEKTELGLAKLGMRMEDLKGQSPEQQALALVKAWEELGRSADATAGITMMLGSGFRELIPMIKAVGSGSDETAARMRHFGVSTDENLIQKGGEAEVALGNLGLAWTGLKQELSKGPTSPFIEFINWINEAINKMRQAAEQSRRLQGQLDDRYNASQAQRDSYKGDGGTVDKVTGGWRREWDMMKKNIKERGVVATFFDPKKHSETDYRPTQKSFDSDTKMNQPFKGGGAGGRRYAPGGDLAKPPEKTEREEKAKAIQTEIKGRDELESKRKASASAADAADKKAEANRLRILELGQKTLVDDERKMMIARGASAEQMAVFETTKGNLKEIGDTEKRNHIENEKALEAKKKEVELGKEVLRDLEKRSELMSRIADKGIGDIEKRTAALRAEMSFDKDTAGMSKAEKEAYKSKNEAESAFTGTRATLKANFDGQDSRADPETKAKLLADYEREIARVNVAETEYTAASSERFAQLQTKQADWLGGFKTSIDEFVAENTDLNSQMESVGKNAFKGMEDALTNFVMTGKMNFKDFARSIIADIARIIAKQLILNAVRGIMGGGTPNAQNVVPNIAAAGISALGNVFDGGNVVNTPTTFGMSGGRNGVMGEAGPEAVMPLKRGSDGKLGVVMSGGAGGGGIQLNIAQGAIIVNETSNSKETAMEVQKQMISIAKNEALRAIQKQSTQHGGMLYNR